jgi:2-keto-4-pentenoate hydratase
MQQLAADLIEQHQTKQRFSSVRDRIPAGASPYDVQDLLVAHFLEKEGGAIAGYKIGLTSTSMQTFCGIDQPLAGVVLATRVWQSPVTLRSADHGRIGIECELCIVVDQDIDGDCTREQVQEKIRSVHAAFEVVDDRNADYTKLDAISIIADNGWNEGVVLGAAAEPGVQLALLEGTVSLNGEPLASGSTADAMHPLDAVVWTARHLAGRGQCLRAGQLVMTGSLVPTRFPKPGEHYRFEVGGLPAAELTVID